jgi:hypothetical protein
MRPVPGRVTVPGILGAGCARAEDAAMYLLLRTACVSASIAYGLSGRLRDESQRALGCFLSGRGLGTVVC